MQRIIEHYQGILEDYCELLDFTQSFEHGIKEGLQVKDVMGFVQERERRIQELQPKEAKSRSLREAICQELGLSEFTLDNLRTKIPGDVLDALGKGIAENKKAIEEIQGIDTRLSQTIQMELEATKLELHRLQNVQRIPHAYQSENQREARFIDKTK